MINRRFTGAVTTSSTRSAARDLLPVPPDWLIEALGVIQLDPTGQHDGPFQNRPGQLEIRSQVKTPVGAADQNHCAGRNPGLDHRTASA